MSYVGVIQNGVVVLELNGNPPPAEGARVRVEVVEEPPKDEEGSVLARLRGALEGADIGDPREDYTNYLIEKYR